MNIQTRIEGKRGCGYRKEGGLYLVLPEWQGRDCGKLPKILDKCPCCGSGIKFSRSFQWIDPRLLFTNDCFYKGSPDKNCQKCILDNPPERMGLLWIGEQYYKTPGDWISEGLRMGISRRIKAVPKGFKIGEDWVAVAHINIRTEKDETGKEKKIPGIFQVFKPSAIEYVVKKDDSEERLQCFEERGITLVKVIKKGEPEQLKLMTEIGVA